MYYHISRPADILVLNLPISDWMMWILFVLLVGGCLWMLIKANW